MFGMINGPDTQLQLMLVRLIMQMLQQFSTTSAPALANGEWVYPAARDIGARNPSAFDSLIAQASQRYRLDPALVKAVVHAESNFNSGAVSKAGARGLMQLMPGTAAGLGVSNSFDPTQNVEGGAKLLRQLLDRYDQNVSLALAAYNAGPGAVDKYNGIPPYAETQRYVPRILNLYSAYRGGG
ncbi:MAG: lytic transglycosylase domain-containing protein [Chloroflexi bacterium]|nr:lytic transglycosylase domain-containing protein [Chloroflexota bacterium]